MDTISSFGEWLRRARKASDLTQAELAQRVGCAEGTIRNLEADGLRPSKQLVARLAAQLGLDGDAQAAVIAFARGGTMPPLRLPALPMPPSAREHIPPPSGAVTFLFTDIEGSTLWWEQHKEAMRHSLVRHDAILKEAIAAHGGYAFKTVGDTFCVAFSHPLAAIAAALEAQRAFHAEAWGSPGPLRVRMALHTGVVEAQAGDYHGLPLIRVARLLAVGNSGQILLSRATAELIREQLPPDAALRDLGTHRLKDLTHLEQIFQLIIPGLPADFPPLRTLDAHRSNLPAQPAPLIGREQEVDALRTLLMRPEVRLVTLTGPGGVGKTRLALQVASELLDTFADGVFFVALAPLSDPELVTFTIAQTLGITEGSSQPLMERLKEYLRPRQLLLLLDNFEQVLGAAPLLAELLVAAQLKVLVTSRAVLRLSGEREYPVPPLAVPDRQHLPPLELLADYEAIALFIERAQAVKPDFQLTSATAPAIVEICARLDGLPLAIMLATARVKLFSPQAMLARLDRRLTLLTSGPRDLPARQQTLRTTMDWSYALLDADTRTLFARLAVFVGGFSLETAEAICGSWELGAGSWGADSAAPTPNSQLPTPILDGLEALVDQSLLRQTVGIDGEPRFTMLETIREYALERLELNGEAAVVRRAHAYYLLGLAEAAEPKLSGAEQQAWLQRLAEEHDNLRAALAWSQAEGDIDVGLRMAGALWRFWQVRGFYSEGRRWLEGMLAKTAEQTVLRAKALDGAGVLAEGQGDYAAARALHAESLAIERELGNKPGIARVLNNLGTVSLDQGNYAAARVFYDESLAIEQELGNKPGIARVLNNLGIVAWNQGDYVSAGSHCETSLMIWRELGDKRNVARTLNNIGDIALEQGDYTAARMLHEESLTIKRELGDKPGMAVSLHNLGRTAQSQGEYATARVLYEESLAIRRELGDKSGIAYALSDLGLVAFEQADYGAAGFLYAQSLAIRQDVGDKWGMAACLTGLAGVAATRGQLEQAARLLGATETLLEAIGGRLDALERVVYARTVAAADAQLNAATFSALRAEGQAISLEQVIAYALGEDNPMGAKRRVTPTLLQ